MRALGLALIAGLTMVSAGVVRAEDRGGLVQEAPDAELVKARAAYQRALRLAKAGKTGAALLAFEAVLLPLRREPERAELFYNLVQVARDASRWDKVLLYAQGFLALSAESPDERAMTALIAQAKARLARTEPAVELTVTAPARAEVLVDDTPLPPGATRSMWVAPGAHRVSAFEDGFTSFGTEVELVKATTLAIELEQIVYRGVLEVRSSPAVGVEVFVDDVRIGLTPMGPIALQAGRHLIRFEAPGHDSWTRYVVVERDGTSSVSPMLEKSSGAK